MLGTLSPGGGGPALFLDDSFGLGERVLWYGFWSPTPDGLEPIIRSAKRRWPRYWRDEEWLKVEDWRAVPIAQRKRPWSEILGAREHYFGFYQPEPPDVGRPPSPTLVKAVATGLLDLGRGLTMAGSDPRTRVLRSIAARRGQRKFRAAVLARFGGRCCVSGCAIEEVLEAAHIRTIPGADLHDVRNGVLLRSDLHVLFDLGFLRVHPSTLRAELEPRLRKGPYARYHGRRLRISPQVARELDRAALRARWEATANMVRTPSA